MLLKTTVCSLITNCITQKLITVIVRGLIKSSRTDATLSFTLISKCISFKIHSICIYTVSPTSLELCNGVLEHFQWELSYMFGYGALDWCYVFKPHTFQLESQFWEEGVVTWGLEPSLSESYPHTHAAFVTRNDVPNKIWILSVGFQQVCVNLNMAISLIINLLSERIFSFDSLDVFPSFWWFWSPTHWSSSVDFLPALNLLCHSNVLLRLRVSSP